MSPVGETGYDLSGVAFGYPPRDSFLGPLNLSLAPGCLHAVVGPNGAGKSTLLRILAGLLQPLAGRVVLNGVPLSAMSPLARAQRIGFVPQQVILDTEQTTAEIVLLGRFPHRGWGMFETAEDVRIAQAAMRATKVDALADRPVATLSGGEAQRVHLAAALAQAVPVILLDEPTASLDLHHQHAIFSLLRRQSEDEGKTVIVATHDLNLAGQYCANIVLMHEGQVRASGAPSVVLTAGSLEPVYGVNVIEWESAGTRFVLVRGRRDRADALPPAPPTR